MMNIPKFLFIVLYLSSIGFLMFSIVCIAGRAL